MKPTKFNLLLTLLMLLLINLSACKKAKFKNNNSEFEQIHNQLIDNGNEADETMDVEVHSYTFTLSENKTLSAIGYESNPDLSNVNYLIEIIKIADSSTIYSGQHQFSDNDLTYVTPTSTVNLESNVVYQLNRVQTNWGPYITQTIGHLVRTTASDYPMNAGALTITKSNFFDYGEQPQSWTTNFALPRIDLVFE